MVNTFSADGLVHYRSDAWFGPLTSGRLALGLQTSLSGSCYAAMQCLSEVSAAGQYTANETGGEGLPGGFPTQRPGDRIIHGWVRAPWAHPLPASVALYNQFLKRSARRSRPEKFSLPITVLKRLAGGVVSLRPIEWGMVSTVSVVFFGRHWIVCVPGCWTSPTPKGDLFGNTGSSVIEGRFDRLGFLGSIYSRRSRTGS